MPFAPIRRRIMRGPLGRWVRQAVLLNPAIYGGDWSKVQIDPDAVVNDALFNVSSGTIHVGSKAFLGHGVSLLTGTHEVACLGKDRRSAVPTSGRNIVIEEGAWIASNATVLGPCRVGRHAVVAAGAVVVDDVNELEIVGGVPARCLGWVPTSGNESTRPDAS